MSELSQIDKTQARAYLMINCQNGSEEHVLDEIRTYPEIKDSMLTVGRCDIVALVEASSTDKLRDIIILKIRKIPEISSTTTLVCTQQGD
jgi:DNA-binding Lrp family transcriptional regulator